ncbi:sensor histidine kinase [Emticicia sp. C21]|uniref:sensor histidine kinase n=1 Tax=Emticicia sp. C21 TaxID=2302915 RepID=UPI000E343515|nr:sensor histidine kinase [Emticicia sp. C21]RFS18351.1 sensor histidine kinase [Emticicia sp. C21]
MQKRIIHHIAFWIAYVLFKAYLNFESLAYNKPKENVFYLFFLAIGIQSTYLIVKIPLVYTIFHITDQFLSKKWSIIKSLVSTILVFVLAIPVFLFITHIAQKYILKHTSMTDASYYTLASIFYAFFLLCFLCGVALAIKLIRQNLLAKEIEQELTKKRLETELRFLKAQTNPHFLFNTLNNIYGLARKKSDDTAEVVMKLSKLLRFMLYETNKPYIAIEEELRVMEDYIELEKIRYNQRLKIDFIKFIDNQHEPIGPLILLPFIENAFKHGAGETINESYITIKIQLQKGHLHFSVENSKSEDNQSEITEKIGLSNVRRQLELMYPEHQLTIENHVSTFKIVLELNLNSHAKI